MTVVLVCDFNCVKMTVLAHCQGRPFCILNLQTQIQIYFVNHTLPETNIAPENGLFRDSFPFGMAYFRGVC